MIYANHDTQEENGFRNKLLLLEILESLLHNQSCNFETHLHIVIDVCCKFLLRSDISLDTKNECFFREKTA